MSIDEIRQTEGSLKPSRTYEEVKVSMHVSVIGIGLMGDPIARNLLKAGFSLTTFNRAAAKCEPFRGSAEITASAHDPILASEVVVLAVPGDREIDSVLERMKGVLDT